MGGALGPIFIHILMLRTESLSFILPFDSQSPTPGSHSPNLRKSMKKFDLALLLGVSLFSITTSVPPVFAAGDKDVKGVAQAIVDQGLDQKCRVQVYGVKNRVGRNNWDMVIHGFGPKKYREEITISECRSDHGAEYCAKITEIPSSEKEKMCQMDRVIYRDEVKGQPASVTFERVSLAVRAAKSCSEKYFDHHSKAIDRSWTCSSSAARH